MMTSRRSRLQQSASRGNRGAAAALRLADEPTRFLSTVQVGITLIGILSGALAEDAISSEVQRVVALVPWLAGASDGIALVVVVLLITYFSLVVGELVPKRIAMAYPEAVASSIARPLSVLSKVFAVPTRVLSVSTELVLGVLRVKHADGEDVSAEDVRAVVARAASTGVFTSQEHQLFQRIMRLGELIVRDLMVPRSEMVWVDEEMSTEVLRVVVGTSPHSHFPVCRGGPDRVVGVVHIKDLIAYGMLAGREFRVSAVAQKPLFAPETMPALKLMEEFKRRKTHIAFVVDEYGAVLGLLTLNDVISALVGNIARRGDEPKPTAVRREDGSWLMEGRMALHEAALTLGIEPELEAELPDVSTVAGMVIARLGHIPVVGERTEWAGWRFEVVDMDATRVDQVLAMPMGTGTTVVAEERVG